jgi:kumamolisin
MLLVMTDAFVPLPGSERSAAANARPAGRLDDRARIEATLVLRHRADIPRELIEGLATISRDELAARHGADPADVELVRSVLTRHGVQVSEVDAASRRIKVSGTVAQLADVFGARLSQVTSPSPTGGADITHRHREGGLRLPAELDGVVTAVLGLDDRPQARPHLRLAPKAAQGGYTPLQLEEVYRFPAGTTGQGQSLAIIELGGGFTQADLVAYFGGLGMKSIPVVSAVGVDGAANTPTGDPKGDDGEVLLDIEVAGALAPGASQVVYFAPNTDQGFLDAISTAIHAAPTPTALSISWGAPEKDWTAQARMAFDQALADAAALGVTVCVASGDHGSDDGVGDGSLNTDFPAASPHALACGGTRLDADAATNAWIGEVVWNDGGGATGGGISNAFPMPTWQKKAGVPHNGHQGRGVPDVAGVADPATGYRVRVDGQDLVYGGTSAVAPLWAALTCRLAESLKRPLGLMQPALYKAATPGHTAPGFHDITMGNNATAGNGDYAAAPGWDACTGLGTPDGTALLAALSGAPGKA